MKEVWEVRFLSSVTSAGSPQVFFESEEVANAYVDKYYPNFDEKDYKVVTVRVISHIDDI